MTDVKRITLQWVKFNNTKFKNTMLKSKSNLCNYSDVHRLWKRGIAITGEGSNKAAGQREERNKEIIV